MMKTIREFLEEQINEQLIQAVVSGRRTGEGPSKVKLRPVELKGQIFYQASMTEGTKVYHKNFTREEMIAYLEHAMEEFRQLQATGRSQDGSILISKKGKATIKSKIGFSAAKIQDRDLSVFRKLRKDIPDKLQKAIDLSELVISGSNDLSILCHNSQNHQKRSCRSLSENVLFHPVMRSDLYLLILCRPVLFCFDGCFPDMTSSDRSIEIGRAHV